MADRELPQDYQNYEVSPGGTIVDHGLFSAIHTQSTTSSTPSIGLQGVFPIDSCVEDVVVDPQKGVDPIDHVDHGETVDPERSTWSTGSTPKQGVQRGFLKARGKIRGND
jgi:hypothetical protein